MNATIVDLRYRVKHVLRAIDRGETVTVLYRGKKKAVLTPVVSAAHGVTPKPRLAQSTPPPIARWRSSP